MSDLSIDHRCVVNIPSARDWEASVRLSIDLDRYKNVDEVAFDFGGVDFVTPGWMLILAKTLRTFRQRNPAVRCRATGRSNTAAMRYAGHAGFFQAFGSKWGRATGAAGTTEAFLPVSEVRIEDLTKNAPKFQHHGEVLQNEGERLAGILTQSSGASAPAVETLAYAIREIARNVVEHSEAEGYRFAAQWWSSTGEAEIAIEDDGIGLTASFLNSGRHTVADDAEAVKLAVAPGVTSSFVSKRSTDDWANSGYGLYMTRGLCGVHGRFVLISETAALIADKGNERLLSSNLPGTTVVLKLNAREGQIDDRLALLRRDAGVGRPSKASLTARVGRKQE